MNTAAVLARLCDVLSLTAFIESSGDGAVIRFEQPLYGEADVMPMDERLDSLCADVGLVLDLDAPAAQGLMTFPSDEDETANVRHVARYYRPRRG